MIYSSMLGLIVLRRWGRKNEISYNKYVIITLVY